jgi:hypothetical protein
MGEARLTPVDSKSQRDALVLSRDLLDAGTLLLDIGTNLPTIPDEGGFLLSAYPTCKEASIVAFGSGLSGGKKSSYRRSDGEVEDSRGRQAKTAVRRICRHNGLTQLVTFTYSEVPPLRAVSRHFEYFWRQWRAATGLEIPPYVLVCEWGSLHGRLHVHVGVNWWNEINAVEVCPRCDRYGVLKKYPRALPSPSPVCIGCLWGRGFVGRPEENVGGRGLSGYLAKYLAKDLGGVKFDPTTGKPIDRSIGLPFGGKRYRASLGAKPVPVKLWAPELEVARQAAVEVVGLGEWPAFSWVGEEASDRGHVEWHDFEAA